jgi:hypothetical protein
MVYSRKNSMRKNSRKNRKNSRKARKNTRKNRRNMKGGNPMQLSLAQGREFSEIHKAQHGGGALMGAPVGYTGMLDDSLRASARVGPLDASVAAIQGMKDMPDAVVPEQTGGRRKSTRKNKKASRKSKGRKNSMRKSKGRKNSMRKNSMRKNRKNSMRKNKKNSRKSNGRKMYGGSAPIDASFDLLSPAMRMKAGTADFSNPLLQ